MEVFKVCERSIFPKTTIFINKKLNKKTEIKNELNMVIEDFEEDELDEEEFEDDDLEEEIA